MHHLPGSQTSSCIALSASSGGAQAAELGDLPSWKLEDLYPSASSTEYLGDLEKADTLSKAFEAKWKGKLANAATLAGDDGLGAAVREYEILEDLMGKIGSFAGLTYFSDTSNPANGKLYGDAQAKLTDMASHLLFFALELKLLRQRKPCLVVAQVEGMDLLGTLILGDGLRVRQKRAQAGQLFGHLA